MTIIHLDTESVFACAQKLEVQSEQIRQQAQMLTVSVRSMDWYGPSRDIFQAEAETLTRRMIQLADEGQILAVRARREADEWLEVDSSFQQQFSQILIPLTKRG